MGQFSLAFSEYRNFIIPNPESRKKNYTASALKWVLIRFWLLQGLKVNDKISEFEIGEIMSCTAYRSGTWNFHVLMKCSKPFTLPTIGLF